MLELFTFRLSHFSEKSRWMLDAAGIEYREVRWTPFFHVLPALRHGRRGTTVPILRHGGGYVQDSTEILLWLDRNMPGFNLLPRDTGLRGEALRWEAEIDHIGFHVMRLCYGHLLDDAGAVTELWSLDATPLQRRAIRLGYPLLAAAFRRRLALSAASLERSCGRIAQLLDLLDGALADGREYLVGDRLGAADITACALLAPLAGPAEHEIYGRQDMRDALAGVLAPWQSRPALQWVRRRYGERNAASSGDSGNAGDGARRAASHSSNASA